MISICIQVRSLRCYFRQFFFIKEKFFFSSNGNRKTDNTAHADEKKLILIKRDLIHMCENFFRVFFGKQIVCYNGTKTCVASQCNSLPCS